MGWMDILKTRQAENVADYWTFIAGITIGQDEEPTEPQIAKAIKLANVFGFVKDLEGHIQGLMAIKRNETEIVNIEAKRVQSIADYAQLPQAKAELVALQGSVVVAVNNVEALKASARYMIIGSGDDANAYTGELNRAKAALADAKYKFPQVFK